MTEAQSAHLEALHEQVLADAPEPVPQELVHVSQGHVCAVHDAAQVLLGCPQRCPGPEIFWDLFDLQQQGLGSWLCNVCNVQQQGMLSQSNVPRPSTVLPDKTSLLNSTAALYRQQTQADQSSGAHVAGKAFDRQGGVGESHTGVWPLEDGDILDAQPPLDL